MSANRTIVDYLEDDMYRSALFAAVSAVSLVISFMGFDDPIDPAWVAIVLCGLPILWDAVTGLALRHDIKADVLVAMAIVASVAMGEYFVAGEVAFIMALGGLLEDVSAARSRAGVEALADTIPNEVRVVEDGEIRIADPESVAVGARVRILPGAVIPLDGTVVSGNSYVDQSSLTGEPVPVAKSEGDEVFSGTVNQQGTFDMEVTRTADDSSFQKLVRMVDGANTETRIVKTADRWATYLVAAVFGLTALVLLLTEDVHRALTVMVVFCPCAFILATPTAVVAAIGNLSKHGILVRDGDSLETMPAVDRIVFDKTGTLTEGRPEVVSVKLLSDMDEETVLRYAGAAERSSEHPYAGAILAKCGDMRLPDSEGVEIVPGSGISASVEGHTVSVGNAAFTGTDTALTDLGRDTAVCVSVDSVPVAVIAVGDVIREGARDAVSSIRESGADCVMLTGDSESAASAVAAEVGIDHHISGCRPEDKLASIGKMKDEGRVVCMIGDGINDAPSLKAADVGIAMGGTGSGMAIDVSDMVIVGDELGKIPYLRYLTGKMLSRIKLNITFGMCWNFMAVALAVTGTVSAVEGAIIHNVGSVAVVLSSFLLLFAGRDRKRFSGPGGSIAPRTVPGDLKDIAQQ